MRNVIHGHRMRCGPFSQRTLWFECDIGRTELRPHVHRWLPCQTWRDGGLIRANVKDLRPRALIWTPHLDLLTGQSLRDLTSAILEITSDDGADRTHYHAGWQEPAVSAMRAVVAFCRGM